MSAETPKKNPLTRNSLLRALEEVRSSLLGTDAEKMPSEINEQMQALPISIDSAAPTKRLNKQPAKTIAAYSRAPHVLPGQQSLFDEQLNDPTSLTQISRKKPSDPLLALHTAEKTATRKTRSRARDRNVTNTKESPLAQTMDPFDSTTDTALMDELVAKYLPQIEKELREKLRLLLAQQSPE